MFVFLQAQLFFFGGGAVIIHMREEAEPHGRAVFRWKCTNSRFWNGTNFPTLDTGDIAEKNWAENKRFLV